MTEKDMEKAQRLNEVYKYVFAHFDIKSQKDFADFLHVQRTGLSAAMNGSKANLTKNLFTKICAAFPGVFNLDYLLTGDGHLLTIEEEVKSEDIERTYNPKQPAIPDYVQKLFDEAVRMSTRNELLERQCEKLIGELCDSKDKNETFLSELRKSKEFNDSLVADLVISRKQNDALITELRETRKENAALTNKLEAVLEGIESMKNQVSMLVSSYSVVAPSSPTIVNDVPGTIEPVIKIPIPNIIAGKGTHYAGIVPEGLIRGHQFVAEEIVKKAVKEMNKEKPKKKK
jgi:transcriptional regulator with XRE-family HTH domain